MTLEEWNAKIEIQNIDRADELRRDYVKAFIDAESEAYRQRISPMRKGSGGYCYTGYLWEAMHAPVTMHFEEMARQNIVGKVYAMWDINAQGMNPLQNHGMFHKRDVLRLEYPWLLRGLAFLPGDLYVFDNGFRWTLALTHEEVGGKRYCLKVGQYTQHQQSVPPERDKTAGLPLNDR